MESIRDISKRRLYLHKQTKISKNNWIWNFFFLNLDYVVAITIIIQHLYNILQPHKEYCLLNHNCDFPKIEEDKIIEKEGYYLFKIGENNDYIWSGKVINHTIMICFEEYYKNVKKS